MILEHVISHQKIYDLSLKCYIQKGGEILDPEQFT